MARLTLTQKHQLMYPWEYALGDKAYVGCPEFLSEYKDYGSLTDDQRKWNDQLQFAVATSTLCLLSRAAAMPSIPRGAARF